MASVITATTTSGLTQSADNSGVLQLASGTGNLVTVPSVTGTAMVSGNMPAFSVYMSANQAPANNTTTKVALDTEVFDTANCFNTTNYRFTPNVAGYYLISGAVAGYSSNTSLVSSYTMLYKNGTTIFGAAYTINVPYSLLLQCSASAIVYLNGTTDYVELYGLVNAGSSSQLFAGSSQQYTVMSGSLIRAA